MIALVVGLTARQGRSYDFLREKTEKEREFTVVFLDEIM